jgi:hypothetical protein
MKQLRATSAAAGGLDEAGVSARAHQPSVSSGHVQERQVLGQRAGVAHGLLRSHHRLGLCRPQNPPQTHPSQGMLHLPIIQYNAILSEEENFTSY